MKAIRVYMSENPLVGWIFAAVLAIASGYMLYSRLNPRNETKQLTEMVTIRCSETGDTWTMPRGAMEKQLYMRSYPVDPNEGLTNPKTGKNTGFPVDAWKETVTRVNTERQAVEDASKPQPAANAGK